MTSVTSVEGSTFSYDSLELIKIYAVQHSDGTSARLRRTKLVAYMSDLLKVEQIDVLISCWISGQILASYLVVWIIWL